MNEYPPKLTHIQGQICLLIVHGEDIRALSGKVVPNYHEIRQYAS